MAYRELCGDCCTEHCKEALRRVAQGRLIKERCGECCGEGLRGALLEKSCGELETPLLGVQLIAYFTEYGMSQYKFILQPF